MELQEKNLIKPVIASPEVTKHILTRFKLTASKKLGQNFIIDPEITKKIVKVAELTKQDQVLEIGPGIGTLTQALAESSANVVSVEIDDRLIPILDATLSEYKNIQIIHGDILKTIIMEHVHPGFKCCANLPYYITTPIIFSLLEQKLPLERMVVMVQKEVAERMTANPGGKEYGALSVAIQYYTEPKIAFTVPSTAFYPAPNVESAVLVCKKRSTPPVDIKNEILFFRVIKSAFSLRRKMLNNSLKNMGLTSDEVKSWLKKAGIDGQRRAETLSLQEFANLSNTLENTINEK